jgi:hypothetical protein
VSERPDLEFFLDPVCPFAWLTSRWVVRVAELRDLRVGWRFISLRMINQWRSEENAEFGAAHRLGLGTLRIMAAARELGGDEAVGRLYAGWGQRLWHGPPGPAITELLEGIDRAAWLADAGLPPELAAAADDLSRDELIAAESQLALGRAGEDVGTPIITFGPPDGPSYFGPVISSLPEDDESLRLYDLVTELARFPGFSELKRSNRPPLDLPRLRPTD